jgi:hypothetical protein
LTHVFFEDPSNDLLVLFRRHWYLLAAPAMRGLSTAQP